MRHYYVNFRLISNVNVIKPVHVACIKELLTLSSVRPIQSLMCFETGESLQLHFPSVCIVFDTFKSRGNRASKIHRREFVCWLAGCLTSQQHASVSQGRICSDNFTCCHTEIEVADQTFYFTQSQYTDTGPTCTSTDLITPGVWQGSHWSANFEVTGMTRPRKNPVAKRDWNPGSSALEADALTTKPTRRSQRRERQR